jgi:hypothetical protein
MQRGMVDGEWLMVEAERQSLSRVLSNQPALRKYSETRRRDVGVYLADEVWD